MESLKMLILPSSWVSFSYLLCSPSQWWLPSLITFLPWVFTAGKITAHAAFYLYGLASASLTTNYVSSYDWRHNKISRFLWHCWHMCYDVSKHLLSDYLMYKTTQDFFPLEFHIFSPPKTNLKKTKLVSYVMASFFLLRNRNIKEATCLFNIIWGTRGETYTKTLFL